jgi:7-cyano-7-deazaguanine synthase in queuosine biosynthesis
MYKALVTIDGTSAAPANTLLLRPGMNLRTGEKDLQSAFGKLTSLEIDILTLASAIFASDLAFKRGERENITRQIELTIPVVNLPVFRAVAAKLQYILFRLSHDAWTISFTQRNGTPEASQQWAKEENQKVLLFSGGLDSFAASIVYGEAGEKVQLVSHITANRAVREPQETLFEYLQQQFPNQFQRFAARVGGADKTIKGFPFPSDQAREETQRTRSFLFLSLAGLVARRRGIQDIVLIAENGQMAIHLPLTAARISAFSTHTAHPEFVHLMGEVLSTLLSYLIHISNPFLYQTKAEIVEGAVKRHSANTVHTVSCWNWSLD